MVDSIKCNNFNIMFLFLVYFSTIVIRTEGCDMLDTPAYVAGKSDPFCMRLQNILISIFSVFLHHCYSHGGMRHVGYTCICGR